MKVTCPATTKGVCAGTVSLVDSKTSRLALTAFSGLKPNDSASVKLTVSAAGLKELKAAGGRLVKLTVSVNATSSDAAGLQQTEKPVNAKYGASSAKSIQGPLMVLSVPGTLVVGNDSIVFVKVKCPKTAAGACSGTVSLLAGKTRFAANSFSKLKANATGSVRLWINGTAMKGLKRAPNKVVTLKLSVVAKANGTATRKSEKTVGLKYSPSKKPAPKPKPTKSTVTINLP